MFSLQPTLILEGVPLQPMVAPGFLSQGGARAFDGGAISHEDFKNQLRGNEYLVLSMHQWRG